jgi:uncharacterized damage-inducible protein DinB
MQAEMKQARIADGVLMEMEQEAEITKRLLDIIPEDKLSWRPHPKAKSLGELAMHIAGIQGEVAKLGEPDIADANFVPDIEPANRAEILETFADSLQKAKAIVAATDDARLMENWSLKKDGNIVVTMPRLAFWRSILLNHNYHHRGQLSTYLRTLDVPLPSIYGPSADTNPFA